MCFGEIFGSNRDIRIVSLFNQPLRPVEDSDNAVEYVNEVLLPYAQKHGIEAIGWKLNYVCARTPNWRCLWDHAKHDKWHIIHLTRRNLLDRMLSEKLAAINKNWNRGDYKHKCQFSFEEVRWQISRSQKWQQETRKFFTENPILELEYEALQQHAEGALDQTQDFLGIRRAPLTSPMQKQRSGGQRQYIDNFKLLYKETKKQKPLYLQFFDDIALL